MAAYGYQEPALYIQEINNAPQNVPYFATAGHTGTAVINRGDFVTIAAGAGTIGRVAAGTGFTGAAALVGGLAVHGETSVWTSGTTGAAAPPGGGGIGNLFGATSLGTATAAGLLPSEPAQVHVNKLINGQQVECSLDQAVAWSLALVNAACYVVLDAASNLYYVTTTNPGGATQFGTIINVVLHGTQGLIGDTGVRVLVQISTAVAN